jgi:amino acid permease
MRKEREREREREKERKRNLLSRHMRMLEIGV